MCDVNNFQSRLSTVVPPLNQNPDKATAKPNIEMRDSRHFRAPLLYNSPIYTLVGFSSKRLRLCYTTSIDITMQ